MKTFSPGLFQPHFQPNEHSLTLYMERIIHLLVREMKQKSAALSKHHRASSDKTQSPSGFSGVMNYFIHSGALQPGWTGFGTAQVLIEGALPLVFSSY